MRNRGHSKTGKTKNREWDVNLPKPTASYRRRAWLEFQRALDPLAPVKQLRRPRG
jgi:hypothetical protein